MKIAYRNYIKIKVLVQSCILLLFYRHRNALVIKKAAMDDELTVLMNGPSLLHDIQSSSDIRNAEFCVANHFCDMSEKFIEYKPKYYVFSDPYFWAVDAHIDLKNKSNNSISLLIENVTWPMIVFLPNAKAADVLNERLKKNKYISIKVFNGRGLPVVYNKTVQYCWSKNIYSPFAQNVLVHSLYIGIQLGYKRINIYGVDFSFHEQIYVDQKTNQFYKRRRHSYGFQEEVAYKTFRRKVQANVKDEFFALYRAFDSLQNIAYYAKSHRVKILNKCTNSYLDMFERDRIK